MFGAKFNKETFARGYHRVNNQLGNAYFKPKSFLGDVDNSVKLAKKVYSILEPSLQYYAGADRTSALNRKVLMNVASAVKRVIDTGLR